MLHIDRLPTPLAVLFVLFLTACAGSAQDASVENPDPGAATGTDTGTVTEEPVLVTPTSAPNLSLGIAIKQLQFSWPTVNGATHYRLMQNPDGVSGFSQTGADLPAGTTSTTLDIAVHKLNWTAARYLLEACNSAGCTGSNEVDTLGSVLSAIGYVKASNTGTDDRFGISVALSGDGNTLAVGSLFEDSSAVGINSTPNESAADAGAVYVFRRSGGTWLQQAYVKASNTGAGDNFGYSVALSSDGNTLAVGAYLEDSSTTDINTTSDELAVNAGAVYVFSRGGDTWSQQAYVKALNTGAGDLFGHSVAVSGDGNTLAVGAMREDSDTAGIDSVPNELAAEAGAAYLFTRIGSTWSQQAYVKASNTGAGDNFGISVALSSDGNTFAVGANLEDSSTTTINNTPNELADRAGAAYVFTRSAATWSQQAYVKASNAGATDFFGGAVALSGNGDTLAVGSDLEDSSATGIDGIPDELATNAGAVYVYTRSGSNWSQQAFVKASNAGILDLFGISVALSGDGNTLAVGAHLEDGSATAINNASDDLSATAGAVYVYTRSATTWSQLAYVKSPNTGADDRFGTSVALSSDGNTLATAAAIEDGSSTGVGNVANESAIDAGAVYLY